MLLYLLTPKNDGLVVFICRSLIWIHAADISAVLLSTGDGQKTTWFRYYLKFYGARTAFGRVIEGKITSDGHRTVPGRRPAGVFTHRTGTGRFLFNIYIVRFQRRPSGHRTVPGRASYDVWQAPGTLKNRLTNRPMPVRAPADVLCVKLPPVRSNVFFAEEHIAFT